MSLVDAQLQYELSSDGAAAAAKLKELADAAKAGDVDTPRAKRLTGQMYTTVVELLQEAIDVKTRGTGGKYKHWMRRLGAEKAALIAIRECIRRIQSGQSKGKPVSTQKLCCEIGRLYETEVRIIEAEEVNPVYMERIHDQVRKNATTDIAHLRRLFNVAYDRVMKGELDSSLPDSDLVQIGKFGVDACYQAGLIELMPQQYHAMTFYTIDEEVSEYLLGYDKSDVHNVVDRGAGAMMCPPQPWTNLNDGGYLSPRRKQQFPLMVLRKVRRSERARIREEFTAEKMPKVFAWVNYMQSISFEMHIPTFRAIQKVWAEGGATMGLPRREKPIKPASPFGDTWDKASASPEELEAFKAWKRAATDYYTNLKEWRGHVLEFSGLLKMAKREGQPQWFPVMLDTRGRLYYNGTPNPQGSDMAKAVLHFHEKRPLGRRGLFWLKVQIANSLGYDKKRPAAKVAYVDSIWRRLEAALDAPADNAEVWGTDAPWCAYAASWELREALRCRHPETYETGIPVHMDATCSGLQHFSALLRDEVGGRYVNLFDTGGEEKEDIYRKTSEVAMSAILSQPPSVPRAFWEKVGITRAWAKKPVNR